MNRFKEIIYNNYVSNHNKNLYGEKTIAKIIATYPTCQHYYGKHLPTDKNAEIVDIGCGDGNFVHWLHHLGYKKASGVDISMEQISQGKALGISNLQCNNLMQFLTENTIQYEMIIARDVIEHFTRDEVFEILELVNKNLKPGGRFIIQVPNGQGLFYTSIFWGDYTHEMAYTTSSIHQIIKNTGYSSSMCYPTGPIPTGMVAIIRCVLWQIKVAHLKFWKMVETGNPKGIFTSNLIAVIIK